jgi:hypothetical protein
MAFQVTVSLGGGKEFEFSIVHSDMAGLSRDAANLWLDNEWANLECEPLNPVGKILMLDKILSVAKYGGARRFERDENWARQYARCVALLLDRPAVRVDVPELRVG